jgi:hypothetical protein
MDGFFEFLAAIVAFFGSFFGRKPKDVETEVAENALAAKRREAEILAAPLPSDAVLDDIVREHQPK